MAQADFVSTSNDADSQLLPLVERFRRVAIALGASWLKPILDGAGVSTHKELPNSAMDAALAAAPAWAFEPDHG